MDDRLLVRLYNVGCGDCIFVRVPDRDRPYHFLIDCGNCFKDSQQPLETAVDDVRRMVTEAPGLPEDRVGHLDLVVATHKHWDHLKGFGSEEEALKKLKIDRMWLSVAMDDGHPQAAALRHLQGYARDTLQRLEDRGLNLTSGLQALLMNAVGTEECVEVLTRRLAEAMGIDPLYVYRGIESELGAAEAGTQLLSFKDPSISLRVLAPEKDIDGAYMGQARALLRRLYQHSRHIPRSVPEEQREEWPSNISRSDFRQLRTRMLHACLLAARAENYATNNTSVVLLLEWRGRRLLFTGDAEWTPAVEAGTKEGSWEVMWDNESVRADLEVKSLDFLKVAHHGSRNATPWHLDDPNHPINEILDTILPRPAPGATPTAQAVVTTCAGKISATDNPVPYERLMQEIGARVANACEYPGELSPQPQRTDKVDAPWIDVLLDPAPGYG
jgi:beta-lactamase superfamily II metal-dependent hydrolase